MAVDAVLAPGNRTTTDIFFAKIILLGLGDTDLLLGNLLTTGANICSCWTKISTCTVELLKYKMFFMVFFLANFLIFSLFWDRGFKR
jgi:hypothetical protein